MQNVYHYFQRACERQLQPLRGVSGEKAVDSDGNSAMFWIDSDNGQISSAHYKCTTCFTLVALCEHIAEMLVGWDLSAAAQFDAPQLLALHPEVPSMRHDRATLAIEALQSALHNHAVTHGAYI